MKLVPVPKKAHLYRDDTTQVIYFRKFKKGYGEIKKSLQTTVIREAEDKALEILKSFFGEKPKESKYIRKLFSDEWADFLSLQVVKAPSTYERVESSGRLHLLPFFGELFTHEVNEVAWERYIVYGYSVSPEYKFFNDRKHLRMFCAHLHKQGKIERIPEFRTPDPETDAGKVYSRDELKRLLDHANNDLRLQILMGLTQGMRVGEILSLEYSQVDIEKGSIFLPAKKTKTRKAREFSMSPEVWDLMVIKKADAVGTAVFPTRDNPNKTVARGGNKTAWKNCRKNAGVEGRFHDLRHTFLTHAFKASPNPALICHYAGLSLEVAVRTYLHLNLDDTKKVASLVSTGDLIGKEKS